MKKYSLLMIPLMGLAAFLGISLSNADMVEAANNEVCGETFFRDEYMTKIDVKYDENNVTITNNSGLNLTYTFYADGNTTSGTSGDFNNGASATFTIENGGSVEFTLKEDMEEPCVSDAGTIIGLMQLNVDGLVNNPLYNQSVCVNYRNKWGNNEIMQNAVSYCYSQKVYETYSADVVQGWINTAEELYEAVNSATGGDDITIDNTYKEVSDVKNTDKLVCNAFSNNNYETMNKYYHIETTTENNCEVTCKEEIEVNFSDPVATEAGLCFQYLIEIKSKVECDSKYTAPPPSRKSVCYPSPVCINGGRGFDAGGPNEDFDACVQECDGGEYSQKCIDSCYSKVYENKGTTKKSKKEKMTHDAVKSLSPLYVPNDSFYEVQKLANACPGTGDATALYNYMQNNPSGYYSGGTWHSDYGMDSICSLGPYYFRSLAQTQRTIGMWNGTVSYSRFNKDYRPDGNGMLRARHLDNSWCADSCYWSGSCGGNTALTEAQAQKEYENAVQEYIKNKEACESKEAECSNERTDYKIVVENKDKDDTEENKEDWTEDFTAHQNMNSSTVTDTWAGADSQTFESMVQLVTGTCEDGNDDPWNYHNIITFPGTWINNKTGRPVHSMEPGKEDFYTYVGNEYCTKLNSIPINTAWYDWKVNQNGDASSLTEEQKQEIVSEIDYNIKGSIENYGYFGWDFDIKCFYAIGDDTTDDCPPEDPECEEKDDDPDNPPAEDHRFRPVSLDELFPSNDGSNNSRTAGFNWTCEATNLENEDYPVQPVALLEQIQSLGDDVYSDKYIDYEINLTSEDMDRIRQYNRDNDNDYDKPAYEDSNVNAANNNVAGITVYTSPFLTQLKSSGALIQRGLIGCNNQDNTGDTPTCQGIIEDTKGCMREYNAVSSILQGGSR